MSPKLLFLSWYVPYETGLGDLSTAEAISITCLVALTMIFYRSYRNGR